MAAKKTKPQPPPSSSSDASDSDLPPPTKPSSVPSKPSLPNPSSSLSEEEDQTSSSEEEEDQNPPSKPPKAPSLPPQSSSEESESESESESEPSPPNKHKHKSSSKPPPPSLPSKSSSDSEPPPSKKRKSPESSGLATPSSKRPSRVIWTEADEVEVVKGLVEFKERHGKAPTLAPELEEFYDSVKGRLHVEFTKLQVLGKLRSIKKKYFDSGSKVFGKTHEQVLFDFSKKIWGGAGNEKGEDGKKKKGKSENGSASGVDKQPDESEKTGRNEKHSDAKNEKATGKANGPNGVAQDVKPESKSGVKDNGDDRKFLLWFAEREDRSIAANGLVCESAMKFALKHMPAEQVEALGRNVRQYLAKEMKLNAERNEVLGQLNAAAVKGIELDW